MIWIPSALSPYNLLSAFRLRCTVRPQQGQPQPVGGGVQPGEPEHSQLITVRTIWRSVFMFWLIDFRCFLWLCWSLAAMTPLLMSCIPFWPMAKMLLSTCLLSILFNNNLVDKSPGKEIRSNMPSISKWGNTVIDARRRESCSLGGYESPWAPPGGAIFTPGEIMTRREYWKPFFSTVKSFLEWASWWSQLPLGPNWHLQLLQLLFRYIEAGGIPSILFHYIPLLFSTTICWYPLPFWLPFYFMCARGASSRSG